MIVLAPLLNSKGQPFRAEPVIMAFLFSQHKLQGLFCAKRIQEEKGAA